MPVVDPTGAGDTFAAALACCIEENVRMEDAISFCNCAGTLVCTKRGAIGMAIPTREQVLGHDALASCAPAYGISASIV